MSTSNNTHDYIGDHPPAKATAKPQPSFAWKALTAVASIRLTVVLFALSMVLVFFGTLGMMQHSIEETMKNYFRSWLVMIELQTIADFGKVFIPALFSPESKIPGKFPFPGGYIIGWLMFFNLAAAHAIRFKLTWKRSGIFLLHAGVVVLLAGEFLTGQMAVETRMRIEVGESTRYAFSLTEHEFALIDKSNPDHDEVVVVPASLILKAGKDGWVTDPALPIEIQLVEHHDNARFRRLAADEQPKADAGRNRLAGLTLLPKVKGTDSDGQINMPAFYLRLRVKDGMALGTYLFASAREDILQPIQIGEKSYQATVRMKRTYKPYAVFVDKAEHQVYAGTSKPKDFASTVRATNLQGEEYGPVRIWMNHPMYYEGETFYQSSMDTNPDTGAKITGLQVVKNEAWSFPYFACGLVGLGMIVHFLLKLIAFLKKHERRQSALANTREGTTVRLIPATVQKFGKWLPWGITAICALMLIGRLMTPSTKEAKMDFFLFGKIPVQQGGRIQPIDSLARNDLVVISSKQKFEDPTDDDREYPATEWLLMLWTQPEKASKFRILRIDHPKLLSTLGLSNRPGSYRYSLHEIQDSLGKLQNDLTAAEERPKEKRTPYDLKLMELSRHLQVYQRLQSRSSPGVAPLENSDATWKTYADSVRAMGPDLLDEAEAEVRKDLQVKLHNDREVLIDIVRRRLGDIDIENEAKKLGVKPEALIKNAFDKEVQDRSRRLALDKIQRAVSDQDSQIGALERILNAYREGKPDEFNRLVREYHEKYTSELPAEVQPKVKLEARLNYMNPFIQCLVLYIVSAVIVLLFWMTNWAPLRKSAFSLACLTMVVHTLALASRMYIGNRPPVTNLYSSAVFIGWGGIIVCLAIEYVHKLGVGTLVGSVIGFATMIIADFLAESGDTLEMLEAVLDTNFWLATHVTCVTFGYVATFAAGLFGIVYLVGGVFTNGMKGESGRQVASMMYGTLCFAMLLSFVGTVLGGIWADQSWGRFWGWDPKENGAVLIVIWNALILHARWSGMVKARGMAVLAVAGNMVVAWSWFGTNQLGIGLHAYGFDNRLAIGCSLFWVSQLLIIALGSIPLRFWASFAPAAKA